MDGGVKAVIGCQILVLLGVLAFWGGIGYLVLHFVFKFW